ARDCVKRRLSTLGVPLSTRQDFVAHSWPKRRFDDWLNHAQRRRRRREKYLQMTPVGDDRCRAARCPIRPVTPEVAGSSPVAPASETAEPATTAAPGPSQRPLTSSPAA